MPRVCGYRQALCLPPRQSNLPPGAFAMVAMIIRLIEELINAFNFGSSINK